MSVPEKAPSVRQTIHLRFCQDLGTCKYVGGPGNRRRCDYLDELLDHNDEMVLHVKAAGQREGVALWGEPVAAVDEVPRP